MRLKGNERVTISMPDIGNVGTGRVVARAVKDSNGEQLWVVKLDSPSEMNGLSVAVDLFRESTLRVIV